MYMYLDAWGAKIEYVSQQLFMVEATLLDNIRQRLGIARALYKNAEVMLFDEATSWLDQDTEAAINEAICHLASERDDLTMLVISHRRESLTICTRIVDIVDLQA